MPVYSQDSNLIVQRTCLFLALLCLAAAAATAADAAADASTIAVAVAVSVLKFVLTDMCCSNFFSFYCCPQS
jgi:hypothetical protein